jgi:hypothetical protein
VVSLAIGIKAEDNQKENCTCSNATLHGSYGLHATGTVIGVGEFAAVGRLTYDGNGNVTGKLFVDVAGNNNEVAVKGMYSVNEECIVTDNWSGGSGSQGSHVSIIVDHGRGYYILNNASDVGGTISGEAKRQ